MSHALHTIVSSLFFFFNDTATTEIYTLSLHDALPIYRLDVRDTADALDVVLEVAEGELGPLNRRLVEVVDDLVLLRLFRDRKSTRLNSSHSQISYAVFCLKKKKNNPQTTLTSMKLSRQ